MALFNGVDLEPEDRSGRGRRLGAWLITMAILSASIFALVPSPYVIEKPGPVYNTLGDVEINGQDVPMIEIADEATYPTDGALNLLTVSVVGNRSNLPNWFEVISAWFDPSRAVVPLDSVYPAGYSLEDSNSESRILMANSQKDAVAAALIELGYDVPRVVTVGGLTDDSASKGILEPGDVIVSVDFQEVTSVLDMREIIAASGAGTPLTIVIERNKEKKTVSIIPKMSDESPPAPVVGVYPSIDYAFPFDVTIQLENVGGPSGGQMFALGVIDKLTPGELNGGEKVAGTGTIDATGTVGAIGGIRQKLYGAQQAGATWFLAPKSNCSEVAGNVPDGLSVVAVSTLKDSLAALKAIVAGTGLETLPTCSIG